jgi:hypothetical protein
MVRKPITKKRKFVVNAKINVKDNPERNRGQPKLNDSVNENLG